MPKLNFTNAMKTGHLEEGSRGMGVGSGSESG